MTDVRMPDGTIIRNVPEGTTRAQLMARYGKSQAPAKSRGILGHAQDALSSVNEALIGGAEGIYNAASAVTDPIAKKALGLIYGDDAAEATMQQARGQRRSVSDSARKAVVNRPMPVARTAGRIAGSLAIPLPGKKLQEGGRAAQAAYRAMQGAVGGAAVREVDDESAADEAGIGAGVNVALPPILRWAANTGPGKAVGKAVGSVAKPVVNYLTGSSDEAMAALQPKPSLAPLGRKAEARAARFKAAGVDRPTTGMVTRDPNAYSFERNTAKLEGVGEDLQQQIQGVETSLVAKGRELVRKQGGAKGAEATGAQVQKALDAKRGEMQQVTGRLYDRVRDERGDEIVGTLDNLQNLMADPDMTDNATFDQMRDSLSRRMARLGLAGAGDDVSGIGRFALGDDVPPMAGAADDFAGRFKLAEPPDEFSALGVRRVGGVRPTRIRGPMDITQQLRAWGGIRESGGELGHMGLNNAPRKMDFGSNEQFLGKLVSDEGMTLDEAAERLWEAGYWNPHGPRPTPDDLLARLRQESLGERFFSLDDLDEVARFRNMQAERLRLQEAADNGAPYAEDISQPAAPQRAPLSAHEEELSRSPRGVALRQAEELRKFIRGLGNTADPAVRMMRAKLIDALDDDVVNAVGDDAFKAARASAKARFDEFSKTFAGRIADEGIAPERLTKRVLSDTTSLADLRAMRKSLLGGTEEQAARGKEAWQGLRAQALEDLLSKSMGDEGKLLGGQLSRDFVKQSAKLRELLDPADYKELRRLVLASRDATVAPPGSSVNYSNTAPTIANMFQSSKPAVRDGWLKLLAKMGVKHGAAFAAAGPPGNIALAVGEHVASSAANQKAAELLIRRVRMAQNPEEAAAAIAAMRNVAKSNPVVASFLQKYGAGVGGAGAAVAGEAR